MKQERQCATFAMRGNPALQKPQLLHQDVKLNNFQLLGQQSVITHMRDTYQRQHWVLL